MELIALTALFVECDWGMSFGKSSSSRYVFEAAHDDDFHCLCCSLFVFLFVDEQKSSSSSSASRNLWVSGLSASTRAADLKTLFSKHGKVMVLYCLFA